MFKDVAFSSANEGWTVGYYAPGTNGVGPLLGRWDGATWSLVPSGIPGTFLNGVTALSADDVWAVGGQGGLSLAMHWDGVDWEIVATPNISTTSEGLFDVSGVSSNDVWAVGHIGVDMPGAPLILHWDGTSWTSALTASPNIPENFPTRLYSVDALSSDDVWAVGIREAITHTSVPLIMHYDGGEWTQFALSDDFGDLHAVEAIAPDDVWAVGLDRDEGQTRSRTVHWDGQMWSVIPSPNLPENEWCVLYGVAAESSDRVWAVGECHMGTGTSSTLTMLWDGSEWTLVESPDGDTSAYNRLEDIAIAEPGDLFAVGYFGDINSYETLIERHTTLPCTPTVTPNPPTGTPVPPTATNTAEPTITPCAVTFTDVPDNHPFYTYVRCLACRGILGGYADGTFRPNDLITRGQIAKVVSNAAGIADDPGAQIYEDVDPANPFYMWINRLSLRGIMSGYPCGGEGEPCGADNRPYFRPFAQATRAQIAKIVSNAAGFEDTPPGQTFEDIPINHAFYMWIERLASRGHMGGYPCGGEGEPCGADNMPYFRPYNNATRGQTSKIVANAFFPGCTP
jgi:hypothetical protein